MRDGLNSGLDQQDMPVRSRVAVCSDIGRKVPIFSFFALTLRITFPIVCREVIDTEDEVMDKLNDAANICSNRTKKLPLIYKVVE